MLDVFISLSTLLPASPLPAPQHPRALPLRSLVVFLRCLVSLLFELLAPCVVVPSPKGTQPPAVPQVLLLEAARVPRPAEPWWPANAAGPPSLVAQGLGVSCPADPAPERHCRGSPFPHLLLPLLMPPQCSASPNFQDVSETLLRSHFCPPPTRFSRRPASCAAGWLILGNRRGSGVGFFFFLSRSKRGGDMRQIHFN